MSEEISIKSKTLRRLEVGEVPERGTGSRVNSFVSMDVSSQSPRHLPSFIFGQEHIQPGAVGSHGKDTQAAKESILSDDL